MKALVKEDLGSIPLSRATNNQPDRFSRNRWGGCPHGPLLMRLNCPRGTRPLCTITIGPHGQSTPIIEVYWHITTTGRRMRFTAAIIFPSHFSSSSLSLNDSDVIVCSASVHDAVHPERFESVQAVVRGHPAV